MKRLPLLILAAVVVSATALVLAVGGSAQGPNPSTIQLVERTVQDTNIDNPPKKEFSQGDEFVSGAS